MAYRLRFGWGLLTALLLTACVATPAVKQDRLYGRYAAGLDAPFSGAQLVRLEREMRPAAVARAARLEPGRRPRLEGRVEGWPVWNLDVLPTLTLRGLDFDQARQINADIPDSPVTLQAARPFVLAGSGEDRRRALQCLSQAVYFEAARESEQGRRAVAQTVLNRLRHPEYPKTVCGVVFQGSSRVTGCQFSFTCDGSLAYAPEPGLWAQAQRIAREALGGFVERTVGTATHYHADYVYPYWAPTLVKLTQVGAHIFYRWTGPLGTLSAFTGRYRGGESNISAEVLAGSDARTQGLGLLAPGLAGVAAGSGAGVVTATGALVQAGEDGAAPVLVAPAGEGGQVIGVLRGGRRPATAADIARINAMLDAYSRGETPPDGPAGPSNLSDPAAPPAATTASRATATPPPQARTAVPAASPGTATGPVRPAPQPTAAARTSAAGASATASAPAGDEAPIATRR